MEKYWLFYESQICFREAIERICDFTMKERITHVSSVHRDDTMKNKFVGSQCIHTREQPWYPHLWAAEVLNRWPAKAPTCINLRCYFFINIVLFCMTKALILVQIYVKQKE